MQDLERQGSSGYGDSSYMMDEYGQGSFEYMDYSSYGEMDDEDNYDEDMFEQEFGLDQILAQTYLHRSCLHHPSHRMSCSPCTQMILAHIHPSCSLSPRSRWSPASQDPASEAETQPRQVAGKTRQETVCCSALYF